MSTTKSNWISLATPPKYTSAFLLDKKRNSLYVIGKTGLFKYCQNSNEWNKHTTINELPNSFFVDSYCTAAINTQTTTLYVYNGQGSMAMLQLPDNKTNDNDKSKNKWQIIN